MNQQRQELLNKLADRTTPFGDKITLIAELEKMDADQRMQHQASKDLDWANMTIKERLEPRMAYDRHTDESDWLGAFTASEHSAHQIYAEASMWFNSLDDDVCMNAEEFLIQAQGAARQVTGSLGDQAEMGEQEFMDYVAFLNREVLAASGLDQIGQEYDPKDEHKPTPLPTEVFDNFAPETNEHATTTPRGSSEAPLIREIQSTPGHENGRPSRHDTSDVKLNDAPDDNYPETKTSPGQESGEPSKHGVTSALEGDDANFSGTHFGNIELPSVSGASRGGEWWKKFRDKIKGRPKGKHRMEKGDDKKDESHGESAPSSSPSQGEGQSGKHRAPEPSSGRHRKDESTPAGKHRKPQDQPSSGSHAGEQTYKPKHRSGTEPAKPGKRRKDPGSGSAPHSPEKGQGTPSGDRRHRTQPARNQGRPTSGPSPKTINHGDKSPGKGKHRAPGSHRKADPLSDPNHKVKDTGTPTHDRAKRSGDSTPTHDKIKQDRATDDHIRRELDRRQEGKPNSSREIKNPGDRKNMTQQKHKPTFSHSSLNPAQAASGLDQIQQVTDVHDEPAERPMPGEVAFPMREDWPETSTENMDIQTNERRAMLELAQKLAAQAEDLIKQADMWGNSDSPRPTPGPAVENSPHTTPDEGTGSSYESGHDAGTRDKMAGDAPTYSDASSGAPEYARGYSKGYSQEEGVTRPHNVPSSIGGDNGQALNSDRIQRKKDLPLSMGSFQASAVFTNESALESGDFRKGYAYARQWTPEVPLVRVGSSDFEAGVYAGITDNPQHQGKFITANADHDELAPRVATHKDFTRQMWESDDSLTVKGSYVQAGTSTDRDLNSPTVSPDPWGATPQQGPGNPPPHEGQEDPAREGGPAPYNGAPPYGTPAVSNPVMGPTREENPRLAAFRSTVQANLAAEGNN